jgi:hypothetical protein
MDCLGDNSGGWGHCRCLRLHGQAVASLRMETKERQRRTTNEMHRPQQLAFYHDPIMTCCLSYSS